MAVSDPIPTDRRFKNITGQRFGRLRVLAFAGRGRVYGHLLWLCRCDCGTECVKDGSKLRVGETRSCGCLHREKTSQSHRVHGHCRSDALRTTEHIIWSGMMQRCYNPRTRCFPNYGGRGIRVCDRWRKSFEAFLADMGPRPSRGHSIDRIDPNGNYEPGNCRWATSKEQRVNRRARGMP